MKVQVPAPIDWLIAPISASGNAGFVAFSAGTGGLADQGRVQASKA